MTRDWIGSYGISVLLHLAVAGGLLLQLPERSRDPEPQNGAMTITVAVPQSNPPPQELRPEPLSPVTAPAPISPVAPGAGLAAVAPVLPEPATPPADPPPETEGAPPSDLALRIRERISDPCLIALPLEGDAVLVLGSDDRTIAGFSADVLDDPDVQAMPLIVDNRQCPAIDFARANAAYPAFPLGISLQASQVADPGTLAGQVRAAAGRHVTLLLVDDNGVVQDLRRFMRFAGGVTQFDVPVRRDGDPRDTVQMLIALATPTPPRAVFAQDGQTAERMFAALEAELGPGAAIAVTAFDLR